MRISRRGFLASGALLPLGGLAAAQENPWAKLLKEYDSVRPPTYEAVMPVPRMAAARSEDGADVFELTMKRGLACPLPGAATGIWGYDGLWPGPTLLVTRAARARAPPQRAGREHDRAQTRAPGAPDSDGHPVDYVRPGATREHRYPNQQAARHWSHDHAHGLTGPHVYRGLAGFYIIRDPAEDALSYGVNAGTIFNGFPGNTLSRTAERGPLGSQSCRRLRHSARRSNGSFQIVP